MLQSSYVKEKNLRLLPFYMAVATYFYYEKLRRKMRTAIVSYLLNPFLPNVPFWSPWKHQKTFGFLMFSGGSKGNIGKKRVKI